MPATGSLATLGLSELLQMAALFRKRGSLRLRFPGERTITIFFEDGSLNGLTDTGREWHLGDLLSSLGRLSEPDKQRLLSDASLRGQRLGQLVLDEGVLSREEMDHLLRRLILQSLIWAAEHEELGEFEFDLGAVSHTTLRFPMSDLLIEISAVEDELGRLRTLLGPGDGPLGFRVVAQADDQTPGLSYRHVQVLAHIDGEKCPMDVAAVSPYAPGETLGILASLAEAGVVCWSKSGPTAPRASGQVLQAARRKGPKAGLPNGDRAREDRLVALREKRHRERAAGAGRRSWNGRHPSQSKDEARPRITG